MGSGLVLATIFLMISALALAVCEARPMATLQDHDMGTLLSSSPKCTAWDVKIDQGQASSAGLTTWAVQITNTCIDHRCRISNVVVQCGQFHSASLVNPAVFRGLDPAHGTCIVKNGRTIGNGEMVTFKYQENFKEPLTLKSARVTCLK